MFSIQNTFQNAHNVARINDVNIHNNEKYSRLYILFDWFDL